MSNRHPSFVLRSILALVFAAAPALAYAEGAQKQGGQEQQQGKSQGLITKTLKLDEKLTMPLLNACTYTANVNGTVKPVDKGQSQGAASNQRVDPNITVSATVSCPGATDLVVSDNIMRTGPMTRAQLEEALERRATIASEASGQPCVYKPDFELGSSNLTGSGVAYLCALGSAQGGPSGK